MYYSIQLLEKASNWMIERLLDVIEFIINKKRGR